VKAVKLRRLMKAFCQLMKIYEVTDYRDIERCREGRKLDADEE